MEDLPLDRIAALVPALHIEIDRERERGREREHVQISKRDIIFGGLYKFL